jgi:uncharacterized protein (DUF433 family)
LFGGIPAKISVLKRRDGQMMSEIHRIAIDPEKCGGQPIVRDLRIRVKDILDLLAHGADRDEILADHPLLEDGDITAALEYAAQQNNHPLSPVA